MKRNQEVKVKDWKDLNCGDSFGCFYVNALFKSGNYKSVSIAVRGTTDVFTISGSLLEKILGAFDYKVTREVLITRAEAIEEVAKKILEWSDEEIIGLPEYIDIELNNALAMEDTTP